MKTHASLPPALTDAVVAELLYTDIHTAYAAQLQRCPDGWRCLTPLEQIYLAIRGVPAVYVPTFLYPQPAKESPMPTREISTEPCFFRSSADRLRADFGPDPVVTDSDLDRAMDEAAALTRPVVVTARPAARTRVLRVVSGIVAAACVVGWMLFEVML